MVLVYCRKCGEDTRHVKFKRASHVTSGDFFFYLRCKNERDGKVCNNVLGA